MNDFLISALKYRPNDFNEVIGQSSITQTLKNAINSNKLPQALLFCGPRGVGKTSCARILARKINKQEKEDDLKFNIFELDAASNNSVEDIRNLNEQVRIPPQVGKYKIYIIDEVHMLSTSAFNAFLKTLEEPPKHAIFILATTEKNKIIPTILSRCQIYDFKNITKKDISLHLKNISLKQNVKFEDEALHLISERADGAMRDALSMYDRLINLTNGNITTSLVSENLNILDLSIYIELTNKILNIDIPSILIALDKIFKKRFSHLEFLKGLGNHFRNLLLCRDSNTLKFINSSEIIKKNLVDQSNKISIKKLIKSIGIINDSEINYKKSKNKRLHIEFCILHLSSMNSISKKKKKIKTTQTIINNIDEKLNKKKEPEVKEDKNSENKENDKKTQNLKINSLNKSQNNISSFSLSSIDFKKENKIQSKNNYNAYIEKVQEDFSQTKLSSVWNSYLSQKLKKGENNIASILQLNLPEIKEKNVIRFSVLNDSNKLELMEEKKHLIPFLKKYLKNDNILFEIIVKKNNIIETKYSEKEKYEMLLKKNPELGLLRSTFNLEF